MIHISGKQKYEAKILVLKYTCGLNTMIQWRRQNKISSVHIAQRT